METVKSISVDLGEECKVNADILHNALIKLPAEIYLELFRKMHMNIYGYPLVTNWGGCCGTVGKNKEEQSC